LPQTISHFFCPASSTVFISHIFSGFFGKSIQWEEKSVGFRFTLLEFFYKPGMCQVKLEWLFITQSAHMNHASVGNTGMCFLN